MTPRLECGDMLEILPMLADMGVQFDSCVTDPPYHLTSTVERFGKKGSAPAKPGVYGRSSKGFMGKEWDGGDIAFRPGTWRGVYDVLKPGAYLLAFGGTRTMHRIVCAIEDAGFEIRDQIAWIYGSGFPKSHDVSKGIDKAAGAMREVVPIGAPVKRMIPGADQMSGGSWIKDNGREYQPGTSIPVTDAAAEWEGWGTALKPAFEPIVVARKPLIGTVAQNMILHGTGSLNIDACRVPLAPGDESQVRTMTRGIRQNADGWGMSTVEGGQTQVVQPEGRWPANLIHDGSDEVLDAFAVYGKRGAAAPVRGDEPSDVHRDVYGKRTRVPGVFHSDTGTAARFFYCAKASKADRAGSKHPTVKPLALMRYLTRLVTRPGGHILDPFAGSGSTLQAAAEGGFEATGIELDPEYQMAIYRRLGIL